MTGFLYDGPDRAKATIVLAHGAGAPMDAPFMEMISKRIAGCDLRVVRFEFPYMAARREGAAKPPPPRAERMTEFYRETVGSLGCAGPLFIGGKSYGGRVASLCAQSLFDLGAISGLILLGYPFHPPGKPEALRTAHLAAMTVPTLICQGERDALGARPDVEDYGLAETISINWASDGDHDLKPHKKSGLTAEQNWQEAAEAISTFVAKTTSRQTK